MIAMAPPARHRDRAGKIYLPAIQSWGAEQSRTDSIRRRVKIGEQVTVNGAQIGAQKATLWSGPLGQDIRFVMN